MGGRLNEKLHDNMYNTCLADSTRLLKNGIIHVHVQLHLHVGDELGRQTVEVTG